MSGLPIPNISKRSDRGVQLFFDTYYSRSINISDNDLNAIVAFFESRGFEYSASVAVSTVIIRQAKDSKVPVFKILDTLKTYEGTKLNSIVAEVLNYNRKRSSAIGFKKEKRGSKFESRNIIEGNVINTFESNINILDLSSTDITLDSDEITLDGE